MKKTISALLIVTAIWTASSCSDPLPNKADPTSSMDLTYECTLDGTAVYRFQRSATGDIHYDVVENSEKCKPR